jgi:hypothetical protein
MSTSTEGRVRGTIIKVPDNNPGLLFANGQQRSFTLEGVWNSAVAPAANMTVEVQFDSSGAIAGVSVVDAQQLSQERLSQMSQEVGEQGRQAAELAKQGIGALASRMGKLALVAGVAMWIGWFYLPVASLELGFFGSHSFTFWELLGVDLSNPLNMMNGSHGLFSFLGIAAIAAPFIAPFLKHPRANLLNAMPLAYLAAALAKLGSDSSQLFGKSGMGSKDMKEIMDVVTIGAGAYVITAAGILLALYVFKRRKTA